MGRGFTFGSAHRACDLFHGLKQSGMRSCCLHFVLVGQEGFQNVKKGKVRAFETLPANTSAVCLKYTQKFSEEGEKWCLVSGGLCSSGASRLFDFHASGKTLVYAPCVVYDRAWSPEGLWPPRAQTWPAQRPSAVGGAHPARPPASSPYGRRQETSLLELVRDGK